VPGARGSLAGHNEVSYVTKKWTKYPQLMTVDRSSLVLHYTCGTP